MDKLAKRVGLLDIALILFYFFSRIKLNLSSGESSLLISLIVGLAFFVAFVGTCVHIKMGFLLRRAKDKPLKPTSNRIIYTLGMILSLGAIILAFNSSLYIQALIGKDLFLYQNLEKENFIVKNGEELLINIQFGIVTNPFCSADCSFYLKDLNSVNILYDENESIFVSNPLSRDYAILINETYSGQRLYRFSLECMSRKKIFCYTATNNSKHISKIISVEHLFNEAQNQTLNNIKEKIISINRDYSQLILNLNEINRAINSSTSLDLSKWSLQTANLNSGTKADLNQIMDAYYSQDFPKVEYLLNEKQLSISNLKSALFDLTNAISSEINSYNALVDSLYSLKENVSALYALNFDNSSLNLMNTFITTFNSEIITFSSFSDINKKDSIVKNLVSLRAGLSVSNSSNESLKLEKTINEIKIAHMNLSLSSGNFSLNLNNPSLLCCLHNKCEVCLDENSSSINYPIILLHGHSFNEQVSALASLETFDSFQSKLEEAGYINAGSLLYLDYSEESKNVLGKINSPVALKVSYYFDVLSTEQGYSLLETKTDNLDTYAIRLKDIIDDVKYLTGKDKVIIIAHSMGGLVARRYIQVFGEANVKKLILIASPNQGIEGFVVNYCSIFGTEDECSDMSAGSLFLNKLNRGASQSIPVYNLIGLGCQWENSVGDGIVKNNSAYLPFAKNYYVNGSCSGVNYFHNTILNLETYPEVYSLVKSFLDD